ncbi:MAG: ROK family protein [Planctomycetota bacterium]|nr:ROK family protein [Planctomycetota bacterium]
MIAKQEGPRVGIDIGGTAIKLAALLGDREPVCRTSDSYSQPSREVLERHLQKCWGELLAQTGPLSHAELSVGVCIAGPLTPGGVLEAAANLPAMIGVEIAAWAQGVLGLARPPCVMTDALAAALGEYHANPLRGRALYLALGAGVGGVVLDDGRPLLVARGTSGHFGHIDVSGGQIDAPSTAAAGRGALEAYIGAEALRRAGVDLETPAGLGHPALAAALAALARGLRILLALYRPDHVVLLGGVGLKLQPLLPRLEAQVRDRLTTAAPAHFTLGCGQAGYFAAALGAAAEGR